MSNYDTHPSARWNQRAYAALRGAHPVDPERFAGLMSHDRFPLASAYDPAWVWTNHMGPNVLWLTEYLTEVVDLQPGMRVLDMGCGTAISSMFLAREFGVEVWAADLWVPAHHNFSRIAEAGLMEQVYAVHAEARAYPFQPDFFDAALSIDAYHYWGCTPGHVDYVASFVRPGGTIGVVVPGDGAEAGPVIGPDGHEEISTFHSDRWWRDLWERSDRIEVTSAEMLDGGSDLWRQDTDAGLAWHGTDQSGGDAAMLDANPALGFTRIVARRKP